MGLGKRHPLPPKTQQQGASSTLRLVPPWPAPALVGLSLLLPLEPFTAWVSLPPAEFYKETAPLREVFLGSFPMPAAL